MSTTKDKLDEFGILSLEDLRNKIDTDAFLTFCTGNRISHGTIKQWKDKLQNITLGKAPSDLYIDYRTFANPYQERYKENWEKEIKKALSKKVVCVEDMVTHIFETTKEVFADTKFKDNFYFYHDALSLMTCAETIKWMKEKDYYKHWLLPEMNLNSSGPTARYKGRPVGDSPELMPLDSTLNKDVDDAVNMHVAYTSHISKDDPHQFSMATPKKGLQTMLL